MDSELTRKVKESANIDLKAHSLMQCNNFMQNDTIATCPMGQDK
jgi:hypothetical protein